MNNYSDPKRIFWLGISIMFVLIGIAAVLSVLFNSHSFVGAGSNWLNSIWTAIGVLIGIFFLFIVIWFISMAARFLGWISKDYNGSWNDKWNWFNHDGAMEILRERYAKGEITKEQFEQMVNDLRKNE